MGILYLLFHVYIDQSQLSLPFLSPFCLEYNDSLFLYFLYNNRLQLLEKFVLVYLPFLFNFGPTFFWKKCLIFVTLGTVDVLDVNASVVCKAVCVSKFFLLLHSISILNFGLCCWPAVSSRPKANTLMRCRWGNCGA